eukprot:366474-Chlamydomonas_euryale.AAC.9
MRKGEPDCSLPVGQVCVLQPQQGSPAAPTGQPCSPSKAFCSPYRAALQPQQSVLQPLQGSPAAPAARSSRTPGLGPAAPAGGSFGPSSSVLGAPACPSRSDEKDCIAWKVRVPVRRVVASALHP